MHLRLFAINSKTGTSEEIKNLYWFEEEGISDLTGDNWCTFEASIDGGPRIPVNGDSAWNENEGGR